MFDQISLISHADWSKNHRKKWTAFATLEAGHIWYVHPLFNQTKIPDYFPFLLSNISTPGCILSGFDFPIGFPIAYASKAGVNNYLSILPVLGYDEWINFYDPAEVPSEINIRRPFYPLKPGSSKRAHLEEGLNIEFKDLYRLCEISHKFRRPACPLFWTLGGQQVGKAAINGWKYLLSPAITNPKLDLSIWPFSGNLENLCRPGKIIVVETYPAEYYHHLELTSRKQRFSKRRFVDRVQLAASLLNFSRENNLELNPIVRADILDGFGKDLEADHRFDALVGLYGMINIVLGRRSSGEPIPSSISNIEGWIFGQHQS
jgi:hypothetical protein